MREGPAQGHIQRGPFPGPPDRDPDKPFDQGDPLTRVGAHAHNVHIEVDRLVVLVLHFQTAGFHGHELGEKPHVR